MLKYANCWQKFKNVNVIIHSVQNLNNTLVEILKQDQDEIINYEFSVNFSKTKFESNEI